MYLMVGCRQQPGALRASCLGSDRKPAAAHQPFWSVPERAPYLSLPWAGHGRSREIGGPFAPRSSLLADVKVEGEDITEMFADRITFSSQLQT